MEVIKKDDRRKGGRPRVTEAQKDRVVQMYKSGFTIGHIMEVVKVGRSTVYRTLKERTVETDG